VRRWLAEHLFGDARRINGSRRRSRELDNGRRFRVRALRGAASMLHSKESFRHPRQDRTLETTFFGASRKCRHLTTGGLKDGQRELVILSKRAKGMRGYQVASQRYGSPRVEDREGCAARGSRDAKPMAGALNQYGARHSGSKLWSLR